MYYLLALLLFIISYYVFVKLLSSVLKGCMFAILVLILFVLITAFLRSAKDPVYIFDMYKIDNFEIMKIEKLKY